MSKTESKKAVRKAKRTKASAPKTKKKANEEESISIEEPKKQAEKKSKARLHEIEDEKQEKGKKRKKGEKEDDKKRIAKRKKSTKNAKQDAGNDKESDGESEMKGKILDGKVFLLLGRFHTNRMLLKKAITQNGGQVMDHMTSKVPTCLIVSLFSRSLLYLSKQATHLLSAEGDDGTKTFKQARMKGLKIITEERLLTWLAQNKENVCMDTLEGIAEEEGKKKKKKTEFLAVPGEEPKGGPMPFTPLKPGKDWQCRRVELGQFSPSWYVIPHHYVVLTLPFTLVRRVIAHQGAPEEDEEN